MCVDSYDKAKRTLIIPEYDFAQTFAGIMVIFTKIYTKPVLKRASNYTSKLEMCCRKQHQESLKKKYVIAKSESYISLDSVSMIVLFSSQ